MVVPFAAGGPVDTLARFLTERMRPLLGQPIIIENVGGAGGSIGVGRVARATPDGYTLINGIWSTHVVNGAIYPLQYDVLNDFEPVGLLTSNSQMIIGQEEPADERSERIYRLAEGQPGTRRQPGPRASVARSTYSASCSKRPPTPTSCSRITAAACWRRKTWWLARSTS